MKVTFPHMGNTCFGAKALLDGLGIDCIVPPQNSKISLEIGSQHSPEDICLPYKLMLGNYIQSIEKGADTIIITGSIGPCRFGEYCELQMNVLKKLNYNVDFIVIDYPGAIGKKEFLKRISKLSSRSEKNSLEQLKALQNAYKVVKLMDKLESKAHMMAGYVKNIKECKTLLERCKSQLLECTCPESMIKLLKNYHNVMDKLEIDKTKKPLKIAIIGEIYSIIEPYCNLYIENKLMDYGVCSQRTLTPSWWVKDAVLSPIKLNSLAIRKASKEYLPLYIGGHARECVGEAVLACNGEYDGAIQIFPMGCMPEIVAKSILPSISKDKDFPIMTLVVDEMTGEAGYITRIEAFLDLLERRRNNVLSRC